MYIHCVSKKVPTFKLSVTLPNPNRFSKFVHCWKAYEICYTKRVQHHHLTLGTLLHYLGKLKIRKQFSDFRSVEQCDVTSLL